MSHYNSSNSSGSWQSQRNPQANSSSSSTHDSSNSNITGLFNSSAAANLLAQFSSLGSVNLNNLAANLPALVAASNNTNIQQTSSVQSNTQSSSGSSGYQWHSQNRMAQTSNNQTNSNSTGPSYLLGPGGTMNSYNSSKNSQNSNQKQSNYDPRNDPKNKNSNYSNNNNNKMPSYSTNSSRDNRPQQQNNNNTPRFQNNQQNSNQKYEPSPQAVNQIQNNPIQNNPVQNILPNITPNPLLAQALLTQLAQTTQQSQNNLVAALAAAVTGTNLTLNSNLNSKSSKRSRSRSRSRSRMRSRSRSRSRDSSVRHRNLNRADSARDIRRVVSRSSRSKSPITLSKRLSYPISKPTPKDPPPRDPRERDNKDKDTLKETPKESEKPKEVVKEKETKPLLNRYAIKLPKLPLDSSFNNVSTLKLRYPTLYIPSDYVDSKNSWLNSLGLSRPLKFNTKCQFHIMSKDALSVQKNTAVYDPPDVDYRWQVKVMLLAMPNQEEFFKRCCSFSEDNLKENRYDHPSKVVQFLVGNKGRHELMALGGPWSPSLDGSNPATNVQTLINTAIRNVKALTGIDLSPCTQWFRFLDIQYNRNEDYKTVIKQTDEKSNEEEVLNVDDDKYVENTVIFLPNVWSLMPTNIEYQKQVEAYQNLIDKEPDWCSEVTDVKEEAQKIPNGDLDTPTKNIKAEIDNSETENLEHNLTLNSLIAPEEPTHYSKLDIKKMKVDELRAELAARGLETKGLKPQLATRLKEALEAEKAQDGIDVSIDPKEASFLDEPTESSLILEEDLVQSDSKTDTKPEKKTQQPVLWSKLSKIEREKVYRLPPSPHIIVHPSPTFKQNKFECQLVSLSHILDYRREDNKECSFEVFLFAECFNEMMLRDNGFFIYKHILSLKDDTDKSNQNGKRKLSEEENSDAKKTKTEDETSKKSDESVKSTRPKTIYPELLLSFTYLDTNRSNYLNEKDLEDLFFIIGLNLSRSKCKALMKKLSVRDGLFNYRTLTDRSIVSSSPTSFYKLPSDEVISNSIISHDLYMKRLGSKISTNKTGQQFIIELDGSTIDVMSTIKKLEKCELNLQKLDVKYKESVEETDRLKTLNKTLDRHKQKLLDEASDLRKKLRDQQKFSKDSDDKYLRVKDCLYRTKNQLNKVLDDISDTTRRSQKSSETSVKTSKSDSDAAKKETSGESKEINKKSEEETKVQTEATQETSEIKITEVSKEEIEENQDEKGSDTLREYSEEDTRNSNDNSNENENDAVNAELLELNAEKTNDRIDEF